ASETPIHSPSRTLLAFNSRFSFYPSRSIVLGCRPKPKHSCYLSSLTNLEVQYLILVRCRIVVHPWNTISPSPFRPRFFVCGPPFCDYPRYGEHRAEGWLLSGRRQRSRLEWPYRLN